VAVDCVRGADIPVVFGKQVLRTIVDFAPLDLGWSVGIIPIPLRTDPKTVPFAIPCCVFCAFAIQDR
jgi:hypothetical protein